MFPLDDVTMVYHENKQALVFHEEAFRRRTPTQCEKRKYKYNLMFFDMNSSQQGVIKTGLT